jgi:hypothetical protein
MFGFGLPELLIIVCMFGLIVPWIYYLSTLKKSLILTQKHHGISPGLVWLLLIPIFNLGWQFYILTNITKGIKGKCKDIEKDCGDGGWSIGLAYSILACCAVIPYLGFFAGIGALITWIIYWSKIAGFNKMMA